MAGFKVVASIDSWMDGMNQNVNHGSQDRVELRIIYVGGKTQLGRPIGNFDVSALSGRTITAAKMRRYIVTAQSAAAGTIYRCTRPSAWTEGGVTWNKYDGINSWTTGGGDLDLSTPTPVGFTCAAIPGWHEVTGLAGFVTDALNNRSGIVSVIMRLDNEAPGGGVGDAFRPRQFEGVRWHLIIEHSGAPIGIRAERGFLRGVQRGAVRGGL